LAGRCRLGRETLVLLACGLRMTFIQLPIDSRNLLHPTSAVGVLQIHHCLWWPVKVIGDEGYLLVKRFEGIA
jgi:hypothetical protein